MIGVAYVGNYRVDDWVITDQMIEGLYKEDKEMNIKAGDKVRFVKSVDGSKYGLWAHEFESVKDDKKYIWYLDDEEGTYFLYAKGLDVIKFNKNGENAKYIKTGGQSSTLLTEEEAKQSPFFDKFKKHDPSEEKWYYIRMKGSEGYLNLDKNNNVFFAYSNALCSYKYEFTEEECNEIIGTSSILYKEEC